MLSGKGAGEEKEAELLEKLRTSAEKAVLDDSMNLVAARSPLAGTGYELVKVFPVGPFLGEIDTLIIICLSLPAAFGAICVLLTKMSSDSIIKPLNELKAAAEAVADGDLTVSLQPSSSDETGRLSGSFSLMAHNLHEMSEQTARMVVDTNEGASQVSSTAEEVRKLAEESADSTSRIADLVRDIQRDIAAAVETARKGAEEVSAGMEAVRVAGNSLERIYDFAKRSGELSDAVAETTKRHLEPGNRIPEAMGDIRMITERTASSSEEIAAASEERSAAMEELSSTSVMLTELAAKTQDTVQRYRL